MYKHSIIYLTYVKVKAMVLRFLNILEKASESSRVVAFLMYPQAVEESATYKVLSVPSKTFTSFAERYHSRVKFICQNQIYTLLKSPMDIPLSFFAPVFFGLLLGMEYYNVAILSLALVFVRQPLGILLLGKSRYVANPKKVGGVAKAIWCAIAFLAGLYAEEWGLYFLLCAFIIANPKTGFFAVTALCMFAPPKALCLISIATVYSYFLRGIFVPKAVSPPREIDVLIYIFAAAVYILNSRLWNGVTLDNILLGLIPVIYYAAASGGLNEQRTIKNLSMTYIVSAAIMSSAVFIRGGAIFVESLKNDMRAFGEFYVLSIPFGFVYAKTAKGIRKAAAFACVGFLCVSFLLNLSRGAVTGSILALGIYLVLRDIRYLIPAAAVLGAILPLVYGSAAGKAWGILNRAGEFEYGIIPIRRGTVTGVAMGIVWALLAMLMYTRINKGSHKRPFIRSLTAAAAGGGVGLAAWGGSWAGYRLGFVFWVILSLFSANLEVKT